MATKLTLKLDQEAIERAKRYADRRGLSLSKLVESYFLGLTELEEPLQETPKGDMAELAGVLKGLEIGDPRNEYREYLLKKYS
ncbi:MAG TPA: DUF6364 family protein [Thermoanaerobaculia bacterium]|jgi:hypothetical protein|nr:DUF6364 family protein [Thermoanaerobaculia bacterium]